VEEALRRSEEGFRQLAESLPQLVWTCRADGPCDFLSRQWIEYTGISAAEQLGFGWLQQLHPEDRERTVAAWNAAVQSGGSFDVEFRIRRRDGMYRWFKTRAVPMRDAEGQIVKWFGSNTDIDDLQRMEQDLAHYVEELRRSNQDLEQFAYAASHDLQEPLRKIRSFGDLLQEDFGPTLPDEGRRHIATMQDAAKRMQRLIEDLLNYARLTTQGMAFVAVNLQETVKAVLSDLEARVTATGARVEVNRLPVIEADATQMHQLFLNLLGNALKFHKDSEIPVVKVYALAAEPEEGECRVVVEDNGIGFDPKYADRIFGVFQRLHNRSTYEGSGIGLALCRRIVQRHGGHIAVRSQPGQGTAFTVSLPVRQAGTHRTGGADEPARETHSVADG
jgi:PAS domain S-box-containing protein